MSMQKSRSISVVLVVAVALMLAAAPPAAAADANLEIASRHTTFGTGGGEASPATLQQMVVDGSGASASVALSGTPTIDGFEDGDISIASGDWSGWSGDTASFSAQSGTVLSGSQSGLLAANSDTPIVDAVRTSPTTSSLTFEFRTPDKPGVTTDGYRVRMESGGSILGFVGFRYDGAVYWNRIGQTNIDTGGTWSTDTTHTMELDPDFGADEVTLTLDGTELGTFAMDPDQDWSNWDEVSIQNDAGTSGSTTDMFVDDFEVGGTASVGTTATYISANHTGSDLERASIDLAAVNNVDTTVTVQYDDGDSWADAASTTTSSAGLVNLSLPDVSATTWRVNVTGEVTGSSPALTIDSDTVLFQASDPSATLQSPADGQELTESSVDFTVDVSDEDFATAQGDLVNATLYVDGDQAGYETVSQNDTVTISEQVSGGGNVSYYWELTDSYGESSTTETRTISTPTEIQLYNETNSSQLLDSTGFDVTLYFENSSGDPLVVERTITDGTIDLTGLPAGESFVVSVQSDGWINRRIVVPSIYDSQKIYMLNSSEETVPVVFKLEDFTGNFPQEDTVLLVQRGINGTYQTVLGDEFGATGQFPAQLATGARHRLVLLNTETGERRVAGTYTPLAGGEQTISISPDGGIDVVSSDPAIRWIPGTGVMPATDNATLGASLSPQSVTVTDWSIDAVNVPAEGSNTTLWTYSSSENGGRATTEANLSGLSGQIRLDVNYTLQTGITTTETRLIQLQSQSDVFEFSLLGQLDSAPVGLLPADDVDAATTAIALFVSILSMTAVATSTNTTSELTAGTGVLMLGAFSLIGWVGYGLVTVTGVAWIGLTAIRRGVI